MSDLSSFRSALAWLQLTTWPERFRLALIAAVLVALLAGVVWQGQNVGAHIWQSGWACGQTLRGSPTCLPDHR